LRFNPQIPIFYHCHELPEQLSSLSSLTGWVQQLEKRWVNKVTEVIQPEKERANLYQKFFGLKKAPIIVPNYPLSSFLSFDLNWYDLIDQRWENPILFYRGSISDNISMIEIVQSLRLLPLHNNKKIKCNFVGFLNEKNKEILEKEVKRLDLREYFVYSGRIKLYRDVQQITLAASIGFCLYKPLSKSFQYTSTSANKIYEYAACGLPVIVPNTENYRKYFNQESWICFADPDDPQSIADAVIDIFSDFHKYQAMCLSARKAFEEKLNYETVFEPIVSHVKNLIYIK
jgi:glycosyltransferase involved in cell wall biosynthesis